MELVLITALGIGGATVAGALIGFLFKKIPHEFNDGVLGFAAGVMLAAAIIGLILPSISFGGKHGILITAAGIFVGAFFLNFLDRFTPHLHRISGIDREKHPGGTEQLNKVLLFVLAIGIHNLPEGIAAGVSFGTGNIGDAMTVALGIALQNIPEGMIIISPLLMAGVTKTRTFCIAAFTGLVEVVGTMLGYFAVTVAAVILPFALAFAGGTMLYIISDEMIPETHSHGFQRLATYSLLFGFVVMLVMDHYLAAM